MGRNEFTRTISVTTIKSSKVSFADGKVVTEPMKDIVVNGKIDDKEKAGDLVRKTYGKKDSFVVTELVTEESTYSITLEDFLKYAKKVEAETPKDGEAGKETPNK